MRSSVERFPLLRTAESMRDRFGSEGEGLGIPPAKTNVRGEGPGEEKQRR
jgi:hypothetical protein